MRRRNRNSGGHPRTPGRGGRAGLALVACGLAALATLSACGGGKASAQKNGTVEEQVGLDEDGIRVRQAGVENLVRDCMKAQGFDYVPVDPAAQEATLTGTAGMSKDDFEKQFGYGITTLYEQRRKQAVAGPNKSIRASLSAPFSSSTRKRRAALLLPDQS